MNIVFIGSTRFSLACLEAIRELPEIHIAGIITNGEVFSISYSRTGVRNVCHEDFLQYASRNMLDCYVMQKDMRECGLLQKLEEWSPEFIIVAGWYHMIPRQIRDMAPCGGLHASLLPDYSGGAPLVWAIINGEEETGITFFLLDEGTDTGLIIGQKRERIKFEDTIATLYHRIEVKAAELLRECLPKIANKTIEYVPQDESKRRIMPQRSPEDGEIDLGKGAYEMYNFIRAQSSPYPGAFIRTKDGKKLIIEKARIEE